MTTANLDLHPTADLEALQREIRAVNEANGWFESDRTLDDGIGLLHSEASEAVEAYRRWGLEDKTLAECPRRGSNGSLHHADGHLCKPEGVGSELADVLIRLLDETDRQYVPLDLFPHATVEDNPIGSFTGGVAALHKAISDAWVTPTGERFAHVYAVLRDLAALCDIDLRAETERKVAYNATRGYRHGNKLL